MLKLRLHCNLSSYRPTMEFDVQPEVLALTLDEIFIELQDGALFSVEVEGSDGGLFRMKPRTNRR